MDSGPQNAQRHARLEGHVYHLRTRLVSYRQSSWCPRCKWMLGLFWVRLNDYLSLYKCAKRRCGNVWKAASPQPLRSKS
jgi:hypothetical protein